MSSAHKCIAKSQVERIYSSLENIIKDLQQERILLYRNCLALKDRRIEQLERKLASLETENNWNRLWIWGIRFFLMIIQNPFNPEKIEMD